MKKSVSIFLLALFAVNSQALAFSTSFQQKISQGTLTIDLKVQMKEKKMRVESNFGGVPSVTIRNDHGTYHYNPGQKTATKIPAELARPNVADELPNFTQFLKKQKAKLVGSETVDGHACDVYQFKDPATFADAKAWVWKEKNFPLKIEIGSPTRGLTRIEMRDIQWDQAIDDGIFELPAGLTVVDLEQMPERLAKIPKKPAQN